MVDAYYNHLNPLKFHKNESWIVDSTNINDNYAFHSIFWYKPLAYCLLFTFETNNIRNSPVKSGLRMLLYFRDEPHPLMLVEGAVDGTDLVSAVHFVMLDGCPNEEQLNFLFTDYLNVVVLLGAGDPPHMMILRSSSTNMTYDERMKLVQSKMRRSLKKFNVLKVQHQSCSTIVKTLAELRNTQLGICIKLNKMKEEKAFDMFVLLPIVAGFVWIIIYVAYWIADKRKSSVIVPT